MASEKAHRAVDPTVFVALTALGMKPCRNPRCLRYVAGQAVSCCVGCIRQQERGSEDLRHSESCTERDTRRRRSVVRARSAGGR